MLIFNFHHVEPRASRPDRKHITITPWGLKNLIQTLRRQGYEPISLKEVLNFGGPLPQHRRRFLVTFDDGFANFYQHAVPVLEAEQCPATIFVLAGRFGGTNEWDQGHIPEAERDRLLTLDQLKRVGDSRYVTVGSHSMLHRDMSQLDTADLKAEIEDSYQVLSTELGEAFVPVMAYPWGQYSENTLKAMQASPYRFAFTTHKGRWLSSTPAYEIPRYSVYYRDGYPLIFTAKLLRNGLLIA